MHTDTNSSPLAMMRRTLLTGLGAAALVFSPMQAQADTATASEDAAPAEAPALGPDGYKSIELGMSEEEALDTNLITDRQQVGDCTWFSLKKSEGEQNPGSGVVVSPDRGVVSIPGTQSMKTPEGITMGSVKNDKGSTTEQIENAYDLYTVDKTGPVPIYTAPPRATPRRITSSPSERTTRSRTWG